MKTIKVVSPIRLRLRTGEAAREFAPGAHTLTEEEFGHWFMQACIKEGRAVVVAEKSPEVEKSPAPVQENEADAAPADNAPAPQDAAEPAAAPGEAQAAPTETAAKKAKAK